MNVKKKIAALAIAAGIIGTTGVAYAYWTTTGTGTGSGVAEGNTDEQITLVADFDDGALHPGGSVPVSFTATNENLETDLRVGTVHSVVTTSDVGCLPAWFTIADVPQDQTIAAGASAVALDDDGELVFLNDAADQDACKGATITLTLTSD